MTSAEQTSWDAVSLRSLCLETTTVDPTKNPDKAFEYVDVSAVSNKLWKIVSSTPVTGVTAPGRARKLVRAEDVIFATVRPTLKRVALISEDLDGQVVSTAFCVLRVNRTKADPRFIYYSLLTDDFMNRVRNLERGASYPAVTDNDVLDQEIVVPPLTVQRAIAALLLKIQAAVEVREKIVATLKELKAATMAKLVREGLCGEPLKQTEVGEIPESWNLVHLGTILAEPLRNGHSAITSSDGTGIPTLTLTAVTQRDFSPSNIKMTNARPARVQDLWLSDGDIFIERANTFEMVGLTALYRGSADFAIFPDLLIRVRVQSDQLIPEILVEWLLLPWCRNYFQQHCRGAATSMPKIDHQTVEKVFIPLPPPDEQKLMLSLIRAIDQRLSAESQRVTASKSLFSSMLHLLMTGQVRVNKLPISENNQCSSP